MVEDERRRGQGEQIVLAAVVAGGAAVVGLAAPQFLHHAGHTGAEYVYLGAQIAAPFLFAIAGLVAFLVYAAGRSRLHHVVMAAITAAIIGGLALAASTFVVAWVAVLITPSGPVVAASAVFVGLVVTVALRRRRGRVFAARAPAASATGSSLWGPRLPIGVIVALSALASCVPAVVVSVATMADVVIAPGGGRVSWELVFWVFFAALPSALSAAWSVVVVLLVDQWVAPRAVRALSAGLLTAVLIVVPVVTIVGGFENAGPTPAVGLLSGLLVAAVVFFCERRVAAPVAEAPVAGAAEPAGPAPEHPLSSSANGS